MGEGRDMVVDRRGFNTFRQALMGRRGETVGRHLQRGLLRYFV